MIANPRDGQALLAVHSIDEFVFGVPDLQEARHFYVSFGLDVREEGGALTLYTYGHAHRWARIVRADAKRLLWLAMGVHAGDLGRFERRLAQQGVARILPPEGAQNEGLWISGPDGLPIQLRVAEKSSPSRPAPREVPSPSANAGRSPSRSKAQPARPLYLSHILLFSADVDRARAFYEDTLGLKLSDRSGSVIAFMHTPHGSDHHLIALAKSGGLGLHHSSWCVPSIDAVGIGAQQMAQAGYPRGWGVGRHVLGSNYFRYVRDPWGSYAEYSYDIDFVEAGDEWPAADHPGEDSLYVWGPELPEDFVVNHELDSR
ncbi:metapyrocatechase [Variovorax sp. RKNM96]|uniref:VOC family protein n=1 Tax=Variovorax sp. RKNM96 TaxID=2681552 RepID=UPI00197FDD3F|nr:VOC family protein [Variovorax sp. RKNM96]QSI33265.1 metapyrocatechase [Variovorax sp. RKNM96]